MSEKRNLKPLWLQCLREFFEEAQNNYKSEVILTALKLQKKGMQKFPGVDFNSFPSICNAMRSIDVFENDRDVVINDTDSHNSSTYTIKYKLPRKKIIEKTDITTL